MYKDIEKRKKWEIKYRETHKEILHKYDKKWRDKNKEKANERGKVYYKKHKKEIDAKIKNNRKDGKYILRDINNQLKKFNLKKEILSALGNRCSECGYDKYQGSLDFHHIVPKNNHNLGIGNLIGKYSDGMIDKNMLMEEVKKCKLLCANCHREHHFVESKIYKHLKNNGLIKEIINQSKQSRLMNLFVINNDEDEDIFDNVI